MAAKFPFNGGAEAGAMLHSQPAYLSGEFFAEFLEQILAQELLLKGLENSRLDLIAPDGQSVVASALLAGVEACEPIAAGHDEPSAADTAFRQAREQILRPPRKPYVAGASDRALRCALSVLRAVPEFGAHYSEGWSLLGDPLCLLIQPRDPLASVRILDVVQSVPDHASDVQLVVQDARAPF